MKAFPVSRHSKVLTTDAPYPHADRSVVHLLWAVAFPEALPSGSGKGERGKQRRAAAITLPPALQRRDH